MGNLLSALGAIVLAFKDILTRLLPLALLCFILVGALAFGAAWATYEFLPPYIPDGEGIFGLLTRAIEIVLSFGALLLVLVFSPAIAMIIGGFLFDFGADKVERAIGAPQPRQIKMGETIINIGRIAGGALALNLLALPTLFFPPIYPIVYLILNGYLFGREFFVQSAVRHMTFDEARIVRKRARLSIFLIGFAFAWPGIAFIAPLLAASAMPRMVQTLHAQRTA